MLQAINDRLKGIVGGVIVFLLSITFASWGIQEYLTGGKEKYAASVNGTEISAREYENAVDKQRQRYQSLFGANMPTDAAFEQKMKQQVLDQLVLQRVLGQTVESADFRISDQQLIDKIREIEAFQQDGKFAAATFQQILGAQNMSVEDFYQLYRRDLMALQLQKGITSSVVIGKTSLQTYDALQHQSRDVSYVSFNHAKVVADISVTDDEVNKYFIEHQAGYQHPEQASISYLELSADNINVAATVDEEQLRRQYAEYVAGLAASDERRARHILIQLDPAAPADVKAQAKKKIEDILAQLKSGKSFAGLAQQYSDDTESASKGGDLGWIGKGMTESAFEQKLFAMNRPGEISDIVATAFGYHIIQLDEIKSAKVDSFEIRKAQLVKAAQQQEIDNLFYERSEQLATLAYENDQSLLPAADALGLKIQNTAMFTRSGGTGIAANESIRKAVFSDVVLKEGRNSEVIELGKNHVVVLRINEHQPAKPMTLEEVKPFVEMAVKAEKARQKVMATALQALADVRAGKSLEVIAREQGGELKKLGSIQRKFEGADKRVVEAAFRLDKPAAGQVSYDTVEAQNGVALVAVLAVSTQAQEARPEELQAAGSLLEGDLAEQEMTAVLNYLKSQSDIVIGKDLL